MNMEKLKLGTFYEASFPSGAKCTVKLLKVKTYRSGMDSDYIFQCLEPENFRLVASSPFKGAFPIPETLIGYIQFEELKDQVSIGKLSGNKSPFVLEFKSGSFDENSVGERSQLANSHKPKQKPAKIKRSIVETPQMDKLSSIDQLEL